MALLKVLVPKIFRDKSYGVGIYQFPSDAIALQVRSQWIAYGFAANPTVDEEDDYNDALNPESTIKKSVHVGSTDPALDSTNDVVAGVLWVDTTNGPPYQLKKRNDANNDWDNVGMNGYGENKLRALTGQTNPTLAYYTAAGTKKSRISPGGAYNIHRDANAFNAGTYSTLILGDIDNGETNGVLFGCAAFNPANKPFNIVSSWDNGSSARRLYFGGGGWGTPDVNQIFFYSAPTYDQTNNLGVLQLAFNFGARIQMKSDQLFGYGSGGATTNSLDTALARNAAGVWEINNGTLNTYRDLKLRKLLIDATNTASGTTGTQTINKCAGIVNVAAGQSSIVVTNNQVTTASLVIPFILTNDATAKIKNAVPGDGSFTINLETVTAETAVGFVVFN